MSWGDDASSGSSGVESSLNLKYPDTGYSVPMEQDIASIVLPPDILHVHTEYGVYAMWGASVVKKDPASGGLYFDVGGTAEDVSAFWNEVWRRADESGTPMEDIIGKEGAIISPAAFFAKNLVGPNTIFVVVDTAQLDDASLMRNPMFFGMLTSVMPSAMRLVVVEHKSVGDRDDCADLGSALDEGETFAERQIEDCGIPAMDGIMARFVRPSPPKVKGRKEEYEGK